MGSISSCFRDKNEILQYATENAKRQQNDEMTSPTQLEFTKKPLVYYEITIVNGKEVPFKSFKSR